MSCGSLPLGPEYQPCTGQLGAGGHEIDQLLSCAETIVHIQINARPLITTQNKYRACTIITIP